MLTDQARQYISSLTEPQLAESVARGTEFYQAEAIEFARQELARRGMDVNELAELQRTADESAAADAARRAKAANLPLPRGHRIAAFIVGMTWGWHQLPLGEWRAYRSKWEDRRASEVWKFQWLGCATTAIILLTVMGIIA